MNTSSFKLNMLEQPPVSYRKTQLWEQKNCESKKIFKSFRIYFDPTASLLMCTSAHLFKTTKHPLRSLGAAKEIKMKAALYNKCSALPSDTAATIKKVWLRDLGRVFLLLPETTIYFLHWDLPKSWSNRRPSKPNGDFSR